MDVQMIGEPIRVLYFEKGGQAELLDAVVKNGLVMLPERNKLFVLEGAEPVMLHNKGLFGSGGYVPLYILKHNSLVPSPDFHDTEISPGFYKQFVEQRFLKTILQPIRKKVNKGPIMAVIGGAIGFIAAYAMYMIMSGM